MLGNIHLSSCQSSNTSDILSVVPMADGSCWFLPSFACITELAMSIFFFFLKKSRKWKSLCCSTACVRGNGVPICTHITIFATLKFRVFYKDTMTKIVLRNN